MIPFEIFRKWKSAPKYCRNPRRSWGRKKSILSTRVKLKQMAIPVIKAMIWFRVSDEANSPMAEKEAMDLSYVS